MELKGICLRTINYRDKDKLLVIASLQQGVVTVIARGVRSEKAKLKAGCMPMSFGNFSVLKSKSGLVLNGVDVEENFKNCWVDANKNLAALLVLEFLEKTAIKGEEITHEILLTLKALNLINYTSVYPFAIAVWAILKMLRYIGVDVSTEQMPDNIKKAMLQILNVDIEDVESLEFYESTIANILMYLNLIIKSALSINLLIFKEINKFYKA